MVESSRPLPPTFPRLDPVSDIQRRIVGSWNWTLAHAAATADIKLADPAAEGRWRRIVENPLPAHTAVYDPIANTSLVLGASIAPKRRSEGHMPVDHASICDRWISTKFATLTDDHGELSACDADVEYRNAFAKYRHCGEVAALLGIGHARPPPGRTRTPCVGGGAGCRRSLASGNIGPASVIAGPDHDRLRSTAGRAGRGNTSPNGIGRDAFAGAGRLLGPAGIFAQAECNP